jgi:glutamine synthetase
MHVNELNAKLHLMMDARKEANVVESLEERAHAYCEKVKPYYDEIRYHADKLELMVDNEFWVLTKYRELLFTR